MKEIDCCLVRHFEENLRLRSETGWAEFGYSKMDAPRVSRFSTAGQGERRLWERDCSLTYGRSIRARALYRVEPAGLPLGAYSLTRAHIAELSPRVACLLAHAHYSAGFQIN